GFSHRVLRLRRQTQFGWAPTADHRAHRESWSANPRFNLRPHGRLVCRRAEDRWRGVFGQSPSRQRTGGSAVAARPASRGQSGRPRSAIAPEGSGTGAGRRADGGDRSRRRRRRRFRLGLLAPDRAALSRGRSVEAVVGHERLIPAAITVGAEVGCDNELVAREDIVEFQRAVEATAIGSDVEWIDHPALNESWRLIAATNEDSVFDAIAPAAVFI